MRNRAVATQIEVPLISIFRQVVLGQSGLAQARGFHDAIPITGLVLAKMDGTAKGGAVVAIEEALGVPTKMIGVGEGIDDLYAFEPARFAAALFEG